MVSEDPRAHAPERGVEPKPDPEHPRDDIPVPKAEPGPQPGQVAEGTVDAAAALAPKPENASNDEAPSAVNGEMSSPMDVEEESEAVDTSLPDRAASHPTKTEPSESQDSNKEDGEKKEPALPHYSGILIRSWWSPGARGGRRSHRSCTVLPGKRIDIGSSRRCKDGWVL